MYEYFPQPDLAFLKTQLQKESNVLYFHDSNFTRQFLKWYPTAIVNFGVSTF